MVNMISIFTRSIFTQLSSEIDCFLKRDRFFQGYLTVKFTEQVELTVKVS